MGRGGWRFGVPFPMLLHGQLQRLATSAGWGKKLPGSLLDSGRAKAPSLHPALSAAAKFATADGRDYEVCTKYEVVRCGLVRPRTASACEMAKAGQASRREGLLAAAPYAGLGSPYRARS